MADRENGQRARAAVVDVAPPRALDTPTKRVLRGTKSVGAEGSARKLSRRSGPFRKALAGLPELEASLGLDAARDWATAGLLADAILELMQDADVVGPMFRRLFDAWARLQRMKADRRSELRPLLAKLTDDSDPIAALLGARR